MAPLPCWGQVNGVVVGTVVVVVGTVVVVVGSVVVVVVVDAEVVVVVPVAVARPTVNVVVANTLRPPATATAANQRDRDLAGGISTM